MADFFPTEIETIEIEKLIPYAKNSRTHSEEQIEQIAESIRVFGFTNPVLIDSQGGIIAGHGRVMAAKKLGYKTISAIRLPHLTDTQRRAYVIADNKLALNAGWDEEMLAEEMAILQDENFDLSIIGFTDEELGEILPSLQNSENEADEDSVPTSEKATATKIGDVWLLGEHRLLCGDSTKAADVQKLMGIELADQLLTDPPYNVDYEGATKEKLKIQNDKFEDSAFRLFLADAFRAADSVMKPGASFYIWHADSEGFNFRAAVQDTGWKIRQCLVWVKDQLVMGRQDYHWQHEPCLYGWKDGAAHYWASDRKQTTVIKCKKPQRNDVHPTMKPVELIEYVMGNNTKPGDIVLDLFLGSGTTLIAAEKHGRVCYGLELDPHYCDVIIKRWQEYTGDKAINALNGLTFGEICPSNT